MALDLLTVLARTATEPGRRTLNTQILTPHQRALAERVARCLAVSMLTTVISLTTLALLAGPAALPAWQANMAATIVATVPSFVLNRRWVWGRSGSGDWWREVVPFWSLSFAGLVLSTVAVHETDRLTDSAAWVGNGRTIALLAANVAAYGVLWVGQFILLDRVLFRHPSHDERRAAAAA